MPIEHQHIVANGSLDAKIWSIAWPAILANVSIPLLGIVDAALLGHLDSADHLAAVAVGSAILSFLYWGFSFLRMGTTGEVARAWGANDQARALLALGRGALLALFIATLLLILQSPLLAAGFALMNPQPELLGLGERYAQIRLWSAPAVLLTYTAVGWFIGHQDTRWPMRIVIATNLANIVLDATFILGLGLASEGAAFATVAAEYLGLGIAIFALRHAPAAAHAQKVIPALWAPGPYVKLLRSNSQLFVRTLTLLFAFAVFTASGERLGSSVVAANAIMLQFLLFASFALDGFAYAAEGLSGEALGAGKPQRFYRVSRRCSTWTAGAALLISLLILIGYPVVFPLLTALPEILQIMQEHALWLIVLPLIAAPSYLLDGLFIGAGATRAMMVTMLISAFGIYLPLIYLASDLQNHGLWLAFTAFNAMRSISLGLCFWYFSRRRLW